MVCKYRIFRRITDEEEKKIKELGSKIDLYPHESKEEKKLTEKAMKLELYNPVRIRKHECLNLMGPATDIEIGSDATHFNPYWDPIPATEENREIVRKIEEIFFQTKK